MAKSEKRWMIYLLFGAVTGVLVLYAIVVAPGYHRYMLHFKTCNKTSKLYIIYSLSKKEVEINFLIPEFFLTFFFVINISFKRVVKETSQGDKPGGVWFANSMINR